jgi:glutamate---cysteine ligase / carboxylate-amine ligase
VSRLPVNAPPTPSPQLPGAAELRAVFDAVTPFTVGLEEEATLLDPATLAPVPAGPVLAALAGDPRFKPELPAAQVELVTAPAADAPGALRLLADARATLLAASGPTRPAAAAVHPFAPEDGPLTAGERYERILAGYGRVARRQLVASLQVHVAVGGADRTLAVHNALRSHLPELAALAAASPYQAGQDTGLASVRPTITTMLPRQGVPPALAGWAEFAADLRWGTTAGGLEGARTWWWELRPHVLHGTLELRVPDAQPALADAAGVVGMAQALVGWLAERYDAGEPLPVHPGVRIAENRWSALRDGVGGTLADLDTGVPRPTRAVLHDRLDTLAPVAARLGSAALLEHARALVEANAATRMRAIGDPRAVAGWLADRFADPLPADVGRSSP